MKKNIVFVLFFFLPLLVLPNNSFAQHKNIFKKPVAQQVPATDTLSKTFIEPTTGMEFVLIKGGCYQMGNTFGDGFQFEKPVHEVCINDFYIGKHEVTQGQWKTIMGHNPSYFSNCGNNCPVEQVSWNDIQNFVDKLISRNNKVYRLPTEAEWEYVCRGGGKDDKYSGTSSDSELRNYAWYKYAWYYKFFPNKRTHPVGEKTPNLLGIHDMSGNVWEWVSDHYLKVYYNDSPRNNPKGPSLTPSHVIRGGSWDVASRYLRCSFRGHNAPDFGERSIGFRLVMDK